MVRLFLDLLTKKIQENLIVENLKGLRLKLFFGTLNLF